MKVILLQDVAKMGRRFDVVEAPNGYALNKLIPQRLAEPASPENLKRVEAKKAKVSGDAEAVAQTFEQALSAIKGQTVAIPVEANEQGHLFKAVSAEDISTALESMGATVSAAQIKIAEPIKEVGETTITLEHGEHSETITVAIEAK